MRRMSVGERLALAWQLTVECYAMGGHAATVQRRLQRLFSALNDSGMKYLLVGGYAMAAHGQPRATKDIDVWIEPTPANAKRAYAALVDFGAPVEALGSDGKGAGDRGHGVSDRRRSPSHRSSDDHQRRAK